ncbi:MAG: hypothetical protein ACC700_10945 [Anaerolineales bacterium]
MPRKIKYKPCSRVTWRRPAGQGSHARPCYLTTSEIAGTVGYRLAKEHGVDGVTFFLQDEESAWWKYNRRLLDNEFVDYSPLADYRETYRDDYTQYKENQGLSGKVLTNTVDARMEYAVFPEFRDPSTLEGSLELIEKAYDEGNVYEANPSYLKFSESKIITDTKGLFAEEMVADLEAYREDLLGRFENPSEADQVAVNNLTDERRGRLRVVMPRYLFEAYHDVDGERGRPYWDSLIMLENAYTKTGFVSFFTPDAHEFFPSH